MSFSRRAKAFMAVGVAAIVTVLWCGVISPVPAAPGFFQVELSAPVDVVVEVYYQRGAGWRESESTAQSVRASKSFTVVRLPLLPGKYRQLRFDPLRGRGSVQFRNACIVTFDGRALRRFAAADFTPNGQVARFDEVEGVVTVETTATADDPQLRVTFQPVLRLALGFWSNTALFLPRWLLVFSGCLTAIILIQVVWRVRGLVHTLKRAFGPHRPRRTLALCSLTAAALASYPVVFFGMSFVSPNNGAVLLYEDCPTVPGLKDRRAEDIHGSDVGAMMWQHLPYTTVESRALREGSLPLWNRFSSAGVTLLGQGQSMFGDPLHLLVIAAGGASWAFDVKFVLLKALFACGVGWCVWALTRDFAASVLLTFAAAFVAFFNFRINHPSLFSASYAPWILVGWLHLAQATNRRSFAWSLVLWFLANWMELTSGTVKEAYLLCLSLNFTGALAFLFTPSPAGGKLRRGLAIGLGGCAFALASAPLWWTFLDALAASVTSYDAPHVYQIPRAWLIGLFDDLFYREFHPDYGVSMPTANLVVLIGCLSALAQARRLVAHRGALAALVGALLAIGLAFNWVPPEWILQVPFLRNLYYVNAIFSWIAVVHVCVLAGWGFAAARQPLATGKAGRHVLLMALLLGGLLFAFFTSDPHRLWSETGRWVGGWLWTPRYAWLRLSLASLPFAAGVFLILFAGVRYFQSRGGRMALWAATAVMLFLLVARHGQHLPFGKPNPYIAAPGVRAPLFESSPAITFLQDAVKTEPGRIIGARNNLFAGFATVYGFEGINGPNALDNRQYREFVEAAGLAVPGSWRFEQLPADLASWRPLLDFFNVRFIGALPRTLSAPEGYTRVAATDLDIFRSDHAWPRAFFTNRVERYATVDDLVGRIRRDQDGQPFASVQASDPVALAAVSPLPLPDAAAVVSPARFYHLQANTTAFTVFATEPGVIVLQEAWLEGDFEATLNGRPTPYFRVNHLFKGIAVSAPGEYRVSITYWPRHFTASLILGGLGLSLLIALLLTLGRILPRWDGPADAASPTTGEPEPRLSPS